MSTATVPVDLWNPGQVFACIGLCEAAQTLLGDVSGAFDWSSADEAQFHVTTGGDANPVGEVLAFLAEATVALCAPPGTEAELRNGIPTHAVPEGEPFPIPPPDSPAKLPAVLRRGDQTLVLDHWGDDNTGRDNVKFWAGAAGYRGVDLLQDALNLVRESLLEPETVAAPFSVPAVQSSSFRFDWRRDYVPLDIGFSPNKQTHITPMGYPVVEILAAIGMTHARPVRVDPRNKLLYRYAVMGAPLPLPLLRASLGGAPLPFPTRTFRMVLDWPGKENQARCITDVIEEI